MDEHDAARGGLRGIPAKIQSRCWIQTTTGLPPAVSVAVPELLAPSRPSRPLTPPLPGPSYASSPGTPHERRLEPPGPGVGDMARRSGLRG